jgi:hypothetical protein
MAAIIGTQLAICALLSFAVLAQTASRRAILKRQIVVARRKPANLRRPPA